MTKPIQPNPKIKNVAGVCSTNDINKNSVQAHSTTKGGAGRKPSRLRVVFDSMLYPVWARLPRHNGRFVFRVLGYVLGGGKLYGLIGASYIRFLAAKEAA